MKNQEIINKNDIIIYTTEDGVFSVEVKLDEDTVWLTQKQMAELFGKDQSVISRHIRNIFKEKELTEKSNMQKMHIATSDKPVVFYSLDVIISVGYRVKSKRGTQFRIWANKILKEYLLKGYSVNTDRLTKYPDKMKELESSIQFLSAYLENKEKKDAVFQVETDRKINKLFKMVKKEVEPKQGIFFEGQTFDAYKFVSDLIRKATQSLLLIDNYVDDTVLSMLSKGKKNVKIKIYTNNLTKQLKLDVEKYNSQYHKIELHKLKISHDRFLIIDSKDVYHIGHSLKDLGNKWCAFSKMEKSSFDLIKWLSKR